jgi:metal-dependent HD superfamily phosphatase/phosphodiesterase
MAVCPEIHTKHINTVCGQNVELLNVKLVVHIVISCGTYNDHCAVHIVISCGTYNDHCAVHIVISCGTYSDLVTTVRYIQ